MSTPIQRTSLTRLPDTDYRIMSFLSDSELGALRRVNSYLNAIILDPTESGSLEIIFYRVRVLAFQSLRKAYPEAPLNGTAFTRLKIKALFGGSIDSATGEVTLFADICPDISKWVGPIPKIAPHIPLVKPQYKDAYEKALKNNAVLRAQVIYESKELSVPVFFSLGPKQVYSTSQADVMGCPEESEPIFFSPANFDMTTWGANSYGSECLTCIPSAGYLLKEGVKRIPVKVVEFPNVRPPIKNKEDGLYDEWGAIKDSLFFIRNERAERGLPPLEKNFQA